MARFPRAHRTGFDRLVNFSDATVAIAMTLLVLPLVDLGGTTEAGESLWGLLQKNATSIFGFVLSFLVIWSLWVNHHRLMEYFADYDSTVVGLHLLWLLTIVSIPFTTELLTNDDLFEHGAIAMYVAVLLVSAASLHLLGLRGRQHPELLHDRPEVTRWRAAPYTWTMPAVLALILAIVIIFPSVGAWPLLLLFVDGLVENRIAERRRIASD